jgi:hypothetical protein
MALFWAQSNGTEPFFHISVLHLAYLAVLNSARQALICKKMAAGDADSISVNRPLPTARVVPELIRDRWSESTGSNHLPDPCHQITKPPSTLITLPVTNFAMSDDRNT